MLKKSIISMAMAATMLLSTAVPCFAAETNYVSSAPTIASIENQYAEAGEKMKDLGIMAGYTDGKLHLENTITRAEFVTMLIRTLGYDNMLGLVENKFTDVPDTHWAKDYIALANALGYVQGIGNDQFSPDSNVTMVQAEAVLLRILGYGDFAAAIGWPNGYTIYASRLGMTKNINIFNNTPATRGHVAQLIDNSLTVPYYGSDEDDNYNILTSNLDLQFVEGTVTDTALTSSNLEYNEIKIGSKVYTSKKDNIALYVGEEVEAYMNDNKEIIFVNFESDDNFYGFIDEIDSKKLETEKDSAKFASNVTVYLNNASSSRSVLKAGMFVKVLLNEDGKIDTIHAYDFDKVGATVTDITEKAVKVKSYTGSTTQYNISNKQILVVKDNVISDISALSENDIVSIIYDSDLVWFYVTEDNTIFGTLKSLSSKGIKIDNELYELADSVTYSINNNDTVKTASRLSDLSPLLGLDVTVVLDAENKVVHVYAKRADENASIGIVVDKYHTDKQYVEIFDINTNDYETYYYTSKTNRYNDEPIDFEDLVVYGDGAFSFVEITYSDNSITTITPLDVNAETTITKIYSSSIKTANGTYYVNKDTVILKADEGADEISVIDWSEIKNASVNNDVKVIVVTGENDVYAEYIVITDGYELIGNDIEYGVVVSVGSSLSGDFYEVDTLDGEKTITLKHDAPAGITVGDVITFRMNIDEFAVDVNEVALTVDNISYIIDDEYIEFAELNDYYVINEDCIVIDTTVDGDYYDTKADIHDLENGQKVAYIINNDEEIVYIAIIETVED